MFANSLLMSPIFLGGEMSGWIPNSKPESCCSKQARYQLRHPSPSDIVQKSQVRRACSVRKTLLRMLKNLKNLKSALDNETCVGSIFIAVLLLFLIFPRVRLTTGIKTTMMVPIFNRTRLGQQGAMQTDQLKKDFADLIAR